MLGPLEKVKGNYYIEDSVKNVKRVIEQPKKKPDQYEGDPCSSLIDGAFARLTGQDPYAQSFKGHHNPFLDDEKKEDEERAKVEEEEAQKRKKAEADKKAAHEPLPNLPGLRLNPGVNAKRKELKPPKMTELEIPSDYHIHMKSHGQYK